MDHGALKTFAVSARRKLMQQVGARLDYVLTADSAELRERDRQIKELQKEIANSSREAVIEKVAYTWFNRFAALRFMDANGYNRVKVLSPQPGFTQPEILAEARKGNIDGDLPLDQKFINRLLDGQIRSENPQNEAFKLLLVAICNSYNSIMPFMFEKIQDYTELLLPGDVLSEQSVVADFRKSLTDDDCQNEEVLGWFYQYYISEKKDGIMERNAAVPKDDIPAVTQIFTPHWIVRYLVENSLGRLWLLNRPQSKLREEMPYYIEGDPEADFLKISKPEDIRLLDPAGGSGHMLTYAFDLLYAIYEEEGYDAPEIPGLILRHNLYGVDICDRAVALATFALCMKARAKDSRFFRRVVQPHLISLQEIHFDEVELREYIRALNLDDLFHKPLLKLLHQFEEAKNFGALIQPCLDEKGIALARGVIEEKDLGDQLFLRETHFKVLRVLEQAQYLCPRYHVVIANPPYMGRDVFNASLKAFVKANIPEGAIDLYGCFIARNQKFLLEYGYVGMITIPNWMFLPSFTDLREAIYKTASISSLIHNGRGVWGSDFGSCAFVIRQGASGLTGRFKRLFNLQGEVNPNEVLIERFHDNERFAFNFASAAEFENIPNKPVAYWISSSFRRAFSNPNLARHAESGGRCKTSNDELYLRFIWEVGAKMVGMAGSWCPMFKGGEYRKYYGNLYHVMKWTQCAKEYYRTVGGLTQERFWERPGITWTIVSASAHASFRRKPSGSQYNSVSPTVFFTSPDDENFFLGFLNSKPVNALLQIINPTLALNVGDLLNLPIPPVDFHDAALVERNRILLSLAQANWANCETSWDFLDLPLLRSGLKGATLETGWQNWKSHSDAAILRMQELETENNRLFIAAYGLQDELQPEVPHDQITLARADARKDMIAFVSYAVGCMFGRYSLDQPGLILANAGETISDFVKRVPKPTFNPDDDGILPVLEAEYFDDDIVGRFVQFLKVVFGEENHQENLEFVEDSLGKDIRKYFLTDFYKNHFSNERAYGYKKRPIYWMFSSPKKTFNALIYLHRYHPDMVSLILNNYLREFMVKLRAHKENLVQITLSESARGTDKAKAQREIAKIDKGLADLEEYERDIMFPLAAQRIAIDLDDGVKVNYQKFGAALYPIPGLADKED